MSVIDKLNMELEGLQKYGPVNIVALGDSVTHGCFEIDQIDYENVYWNKLKRKLNAYRSVIPVNVIDAGINGTTAQASIERIDSQVLTHRPDLVVVCFGLNDVNLDINVYTDSLAEIFRKIKVENPNGELIFLTPNMMNTYVADDTASPHREYAKVTCEYQNGGRMDRYIQKARETASDCGVRICDCYAEWKKLSETTDTTLLLSNRVNHPTREMHDLFADKLYEMLV